MDQGISYYGWTVAMDLVGTYAGDPDGPTLLLPELIALLRGQVCWAPFAASRCLADDRWGLEDNLITGDYRDANDPLPHAPEGITALYIGVPTIVNDAPLFFAPGWTLEYARMAARILAARAISAGATMLVTGLGSGDITPEMRIEDIGGGKVVAYKDFGSFKDWVIARWL